MSERSHGDRYFPAFDSLRAIGFLAVVAAHTNESYGLDLVTGRLQLLLSIVFFSGWASLDMFFVLSGFLITSILYEARPHPGYFRNFYARRTLRIMPLYYLFLFFGIMVSNLNFSFCRPLGSDEAFAYGFYYSNLYFPLTRQSLHPCFGHFWSLAVEEHFYLIWPLTVWCLRRQSLMRICLAVAACSFLLRAGVMIFDVADFKGARHIAYFTTPCRLDGLLLGSFVALARKDQADWDGLCRWSKQLFLGSGCLVLAVVVGLRSYLVFAPTDLVASRIILEAQVRLTVGHAVASLFFMSLLILLLTAKKKNVALRILENKTLCAFGTYSYGMYVFHFMILLATVQVFPKTFSPNTGRLIIIVIVTAASFVAAWLSYHLFEKHFLRMKRFFEYRRPLPQEAESESETFDRVNKTESIPVSA